MIEVPRSWDTWGVIVGVSCCLDVGMRTPFKHKLSSSLFAMLQSLHFRASGGSRQLGIAGAGHPLRRSTMLFLKKESCAAATSLSPRLAVQVIYHLLHPKYGFCPFIYEQHRTIAYTPAVWVVRYQVTSWLISCLVDVGNHASRDLFSCVVVSKIRYVPFWDDFSFWFTDKRIAHVSSCIYDATDVLCLLIRSLILQLQKLTTTAGDCGCWVRLSHRGCPGVRKLNPPWSCCCCCSLYSRVV